MPVTPVGNTILNAPTNDRITTKTLNQQDFLKLLITQLQYQDPTKAQDTGEMMTQLSQIGQIQSQSLMQKNLTQLATNQQLTLGQSLLNKTVHVKDADGTPVTGTVTELRVAADNTVNLLINAKEYPVSSLTSITNP